MLLVTACGQRGDLYLPTDAAAAGRPTLPQVLRPGPPAAAPSSTTASPSASPAASAPGAPQVRP